MQNNIFDLFDNFDQQLDKLPKLLEKDKYLEKQKEIDKNIFTEKLEGIVKKCNTMLKSLDRNEYLYIYHNTKDSNISNAKFPDEPDAGSSHASLIDSWNEFADQIFTSCKLYQIYIKINFNIKEYDDVEHEEEDWYEYKYTYLYNWTQQGTAAKKLSDLESSIYISNLPIPYRYATVDDKLILFFTTLSRMLVWRKKINGY
jgi:hypothetical protein